MIIANTYTHPHTHTQTHWGKHIHTHGGFAECSGQTRPRTQVQLIKFCAIYFAQNFTNNNKATTTKTQQQHQLEVVVYFSLCSFAFAK